METVEKWRRLVRHCRVHGYFENSINLAPPLALLHTPFFSSSISRPRHAHRSPERAMKFPRRPNLSLFPRRSGPGPDIPQAFPKASIATPALLIWPGSTFYPLCPVCSSLRSLLTTYFASFDFCESIMERDLDHHKRINQKRERERETINRRVRIKKCPQ